MLSAIILSSVMLSVVASTTTTFNKIDCNLRPYFCAIGFFFWRSNDWQKVQFNTHLLKLRHRYLYRRWWHWLILKGFIKMKDIIGWVFGKLKRQIVFTLQVFLLIRVSITWLRQRESEKTVLYLQGGRCQQNLKFPGGVSHPPIQVVSRPNVA